MCERASIRDEEFLKLFRSIVASQLAEIRQMQAWLKELEG